MDVRTELATAMNDERCIQLVPWLLIGQNDDRYLAISSAKALMLVLMVSNDENT
ncbi:MAG: hypothetical protein AAFR31_16470 [Cyanobacteria bacterium J06627_8]